MTIALLCAYTSSAFGEDGQKQERICAAFPDCLSSKHSFINDLWWEIADSCFSAVFFTTQIWGLGVLPNDIFKIRQLQKQDTVLSNKELCIY